MQSPVSLMSHVARLSAAGAIITLGFVMPSAHAQVGNFVNLSSLTSVFSSSANPSGATDAGSLASFVVALTPGANRVLTVSSVTGLISPATPAVNPHGADGGTYTGTGVNINSLGSISGVIDSSDRSLALMGVFVGTNPATGAAPARLDFTGNHSFASLSPLLNQSFFIGDGLTGTGSGAVQQFFVPNGAAFLQLGFADAATGNVAFVGNPSFYSDNTGSLSGSYSITAAPEPGSVALLGVGFVGCTLATGRIGRIARRKA